MNKLEITQILSNSLLDLDKRQGNIYINEVEAEVINNACLYIFQRKLTSVVDQLECIACFVDSAKLFFEGRYTNEHATIAQIQILQNIEYNGMWSFLEGYFQDKHNIVINK